MSEQATANVQLKRANKITAYWGGEGVAVGIFYKTHEKIETVKSDDAAVISAGFKFPEGTPAVAAVEATATTPAVAAVEAIEVSAAQKLEAFKTFLGNNATVFGVTFDPVDRRADAFKFPGKYDEKSFGTYAEKMLTMAVEPVLKSVQENVIDKMIKNGEVPSGSAIQWGKGEATISVTEKYSNGNIKYGTATYPVAFAVNGKQFNVNAEVEIVSGQLKKPRQIGETVLTMTGIKGLFVEQGLLPKIESKKEEAPADAAKTDAPTDAPAKA